MCRKPCKECPWTKNGVHSKAWPNHVKKREDIGDIKNNRHACHMITDDTWGCDIPITDGTVCIGATKSTHRV